MSDASPRDMPIPDATGKCRAELRWATGEVAHRGHFAPSFVPPKLFHFPKDGPVDRFFVLDHWNASADEPSVFVEGRLGEFVEDAA